MKKCLDFHRQNNACPNVQVLVRTVLVLTIIDTVLLLTITYRSIDHNEWGIYFELFLVYKHYVYMYVYPFQPFALVTHKCRLTMNHIDQNAAVRFILVSPFLFISLFLSRNWYGLVSFLVWLSSTALQKHALDAPEKAVYRDGDYAFGLLKTSRTLAGSDERDAVLCPQVNLYQNARWHETREWENSRKALENIYGHLHYINKSL